MSHTKLPTSHSSHKLRSMASTSSLPTSSSSQNLRSMASTSDLKPSTSDPRPSTPRPDLARLDSGATLKPSSSGTNLTGPVAVTDIPKSPSMATTRPPMSRVPTSTDLPTPDALKGGPDFPNAPILTTMTTGRPSMPPVTSAATTIPTSPTLKPGASSPPTLPSSPTGHKKPATTSSPRRSVEHENDLEPLTRTSKHVDSSPVSVAPTANTLRSESVLSPLPVVVTPEHAEGMTGRRASHP